MLRLIVHADDFGLSKHINDGIAMAHERGILTSASLIANAPAFDHAADICHAMPTLDVGLHLTLVELRPVLAPAEVPTLVDSHATFVEHASVLAGRYFARRIDMDQVRAEFEAQILKALGRGLRITHFDSHQHAHLLPRIFRVTTELARKYKIANVRLPSERLHPYMLKDITALRRVAQLLGLGTLALLGRRASVGRTDRFVGFYFGGRLNKQNLLRLILALPGQGTCELMCHPGFDDPFSEYAYWGYRWSDELAALCDKEVAESLCQRGIRLISFRELSSAWHSL